MTRTTLAVRLDSIGDVLVTGPAVRAIAGDARVELLCGPVGAAAGRLLPGVDWVHTWRCPWIASPAPPVDRASIAALLSIVRRAAPDEAVIFTSFHQSPLPTALLLRLAGVPRIVGASVDYAGSLLDLRLRPGEDFPESQSEVSRALAIAEAAGHRLPEGDDGRLAIRPRDARFARPGRYVVVHPGASAASRRWPAAHHAAAVRALVDAGLRVVVTGAESERALTARVAGDVAVDLGGRTGLDELATVLAGADAVVVGNTGAAHLAAAVGTPVVSLFSPVVDERCWRPFGVPLVVLGIVDAGCAGSRARECPVAGHPCLSRVSPDRVVEAVLAIRRDRSVQRAEVEVPA